MQTPEIIITADGSHSLLNVHLNETYHSRHGAVQESAHVFIHNGLDYILSAQAPAPDIVRILEVGFGTGLNAWLAFQHTLKMNCSIHYTTLEAYPVHEKLWSKLNYADALPDLKPYFIKLHEAPWMKEEQIHPGFRLLKKNISLQEVVMQPDSFDVVFFDAFAPNKQPEMWEISLLIKVVQSMAKNGVFVTYCAKGQLKRDLRNAGLRVESLAGPPGKREMIRAIKS